MTARYHLHLVSDSTGETNETIIRACLAQFEGVDVELHPYTMIRNPDDLELVLTGVRNNPGPVMFTLVNKNIRTALQRVCADRNMPCISVIDPVIEALARYFNRDMTGRPGGQHILNAEYFERIEAMNWVVNHDDGQGSDNLEEADIILVGVSRTSKTPTCNYIASHWGLKAANVPIIPNVAPPQALFEAEKPFVVGLTVAPERLIAVRRNRLAILRQEETDYVDEEIVRQEVADARRLFSKRGWPTIDVTRRSIEETAAAIFKLYSRHTGQDEAADDPAQQ